PSMFANNGGNVDVTIVTQGICVWVEIAEGRDGGFPTSLPGRQGFVRYHTRGTSFVVTDSTDGDFLTVALFCTGTGHVTLPATSTTITSHGICTFGGTSAYAFATGTFEYDTAEDIEGFETYSAYQDDSLSISGFQDIPCGRGNNGGKFLRPSHREIEQGTVIEIMIDSESFPSGMPSDQPSVIPSIIPSSWPSSQPSDQPSSSTIPSAIPSAQPSTVPSIIPSSLPSSQPSMSPSFSSSPSSWPSESPSASVSPSNSVSPSSVPSVFPSSVPSLLPSASPSSDPSVFPSSAPSVLPSESPSVSAEPSSAPSAFPSISAAPSTLSQTLVAGNETFDLVGYGKCQDRYGRHYSNILVSTLEMPSLSDAVDCGTFCTDASSNSTLINRRTDLVGFTFVQQLEPHCFCYFDRGAVFVHASEDVPYAGTADDAGEGQGLDSAETSMPGITITLHTRPQTQQRNAVASASKLCRHSTSCFCYYDAAVARLGSTLGGVTQILDGYNLHGGNDNSGMCVLLKDDHAASNLYGPTLATEGFDDEGTPEGFGFEAHGTFHQLKMYCRRGVTSVTLPPFVEGIQHAICTFGENNPDTISVSPINDGGICIFIGGHQRDVWGPSLTTLGWIYQGLPAGFGYGTVSLALYCQYELAAAADIQLPPFHDFTIDDPGADWGISHGICTFGNFDSIPSSSDPSLTYERVVISSINEPVQMWGDSVHYQVSGFESTPCQTFYRSSLTNAPYNAVTTLNNPVFCVMTADANNLYYVSWQESLESEEYGFTRLDSQGLYMRLNGGVDVGTTSNLILHCKYNAASATLPPLPGGAGDRMVRGLCAFGYDSATATISGNPFIAIPTSGLSEPWNLWNDNPYWDLHGF
ncbi:hypothetical protein THAOC_19582, partial [Thalassiosira oceanica]